MITEFDSFFYPHICVIKRSSGTSDILGDEIFNTIYEGVGGLQIGVNGDSRLNGTIYQRVPTLIIPVTNIKFVINDYVIVKLPNGIQENYTVRSAKIELGEGVEGTTLWLKKGVEDE